MMYLCPHCKVYLEIGEEWRGREVCCAVCGKAFTVSEASPKIGGMVTAWVLYGFFQLVHFCTMLVWQIVAYSYHNDKDYWLKTQSLERAVEVILNLSTTPTRIFILVATIFTIIYMNRVSNKLATAGGLATLNRIKSAAVICGILFAASNIILFLTNYSFLRIIPSPEIIYLINIFSVPFVAINTLSGALTIIFTVKYWIWKKSQINQ